MTKRKRVPVSISVLILILVLGGIYFVERAVSKEFEVTRVIDGDTLEVQTNSGKEIVRLLGVDAPEQNKCFYQESKDKLTNLVQDKKVLLKSDLYNENKDEYGRLLRYVYLPDGTLVNGELISEGFAKHYSFFQTYLVNYFKKEEQNAQRNNLGLWQTCN